MDLLKAFRKPCEGCYLTAERTLDTHRNYGIFLAISGENWLSVSCRSFGEFHLKWVSDEERDQTTDEMRDCGPK